MRPEKLAHEQKKEIMEFFSLDAVSDQEKNKESDMLFFSGEIQERRDVNRRMEELFPEYFEERNGLNRENGLKKKFCWLFMEYFFMSSGIPLKVFMGGVEKNIILRILSKVNGNQREAARILGVKHTTLNEKLKKYNIRFRKKAYYF